MTLDASKVKLLALIQVVALIVLGFFLLRGGDDRVVTAHFDRAIAVYPGTDLRVMGAPNFIEALFPKSTPAIVIHPALRRRRSTSSSQSGRISGTDDNRNYV